MPQLDFVTYMSQLYVFLAFWVGMFFFIFLFLLTLSLGVLVARHYFHQFVYYRDLSTSQSYIYSFSRAIYYDRLFKIYKTIFDTVTLRQF